MAKIASLDHAVVASALLLLALTSFVLGNPKSEAAQEVWDIVTDPRRYNSEIMPFPDKKQPLLVETSLILRHFDPDDSNMVLSVDLSLQMYWLDSRLSYSTPAVPHVRFSSASHFWVPRASFADSTMTSSMTSSSGTSRERNDAFQSDSFIQVSNRGDVLYSSRQHLELSCKMDLKAFPHDVQICPIKLSSFGYSTEDIVFFFIKDKPLRLSSQPILSTRFVLQDMGTNFTCNTKTITGGYSCLEARLTIARVSDIYLKEWYFPVTCLVGVSFLSEFVPASFFLSRLVLTVGPLLVLVTSSISYSKHLPRVHHLTALDFFTGVSHFTIFVTLLHVIISHHFVRKRGIKGKQVKEDDVEVASRLKRCWAKLKQVADCAFKVFIIGFYLFFVCLYFVACSL